MAEYIDREALREILENWRDAHADVDDEEGCGLLEDVIWEVDAQPAAYPIENQQRRTAADATLEDYQQRINALRERQRWMPVRERLPENAGHPGALCPVYLVATKYGVTEGWYNPDARGWFIIVKRLTGLYDGECDIDFERGDVVRVEYAKDGIVTHWMPLPPVPEVDDD